jgi:hypothetical protein
VEIANWAGIVSVTELDTEASAIEVAVTFTVCAALVAAGAVYVAALVVAPESTPPPLTFQVTPALLMSFVTVALSLTASVASTELAEAVTETLGIVVTVDEPPPQPERRIAAEMKTPWMKELLENMDTPQN